MTKTFYIAGVQFRKDWREALKTIKEGDRLTLWPEPANKYDPNAVKVYFGDIFLGYVPKLLSSEVSSALKAGNCSASLIKLDREEKPHRVFEVRVEV